MGINVEALQETIDNVRHITFKNERGEPLLIFSQKDASILPLRIKPYTQIDKTQLLLRVHTAFYILTFSNHAQAKEFSEALLVLVKALHLSRTFRIIKTRFNENKITIDS